MSETLSTVKTANIGKTVTEYTGEGLMPKASVRSILKKCTKEHFSVEWQKGENNV